MGNKTKKPSEAAGIQPGKLTVILVTDDDGRIVERDAYHVIGTFGVFAIGPSPDDKSWTLYHVPSRTTIESTFASATEAEDAAAWMIVNAIDYDRIVQTDIGEVVIGFGPRVIARFGTDEVYNGKRARREKMEGKPDRLEAITAAFEQATADLATTRTTLEQAYATRKVELDAREAQLLERETGLKTQQNDLDAKRASVALAEQTLESNRAAFTRQMENAEELLKRAKDIEAAAVKLETDHARAVELLERERRRMCDALQSLNIYRDDMPSVERLRAIEIPHPLETGKADA